MSWNVKPKIIIPSYLWLVCEAIQQNFPAKEFSILVKPSEIKPYTVVLSEEYVIPVQEVSGSCVDYDSEDMLKKINDGFNVVIHSHHNIAGSFSTTDNEFLHSHGNLIASILYSQHTFTTAKILVNTQFGVASIDADIEVVLPEVDVSNISEKTYAPAPAVRKQTQTASVKKSRIDKNYVLYCEECDEDFPVDNPVEPCPKCKSDYVIIFPIDVYGYG